MEVRALLLVLALAGHHASTARGYGHGYVWSSSRSPSPSPFAGSGSGLAAGRRASSSTGGMRMNLPLDIVDPNIKRYFGPASKPLLDSVKSPDDMKKFTISELKQLAHELRWETLEVGLLLGVYCCC